MRVTAPRLMYEINQNEVPSSFIALFIPRGATRPSESREIIAARYELCEDLAQMLTEHAVATRADLGVTELDVLGQLLRGLQTADSVVTPNEAHWVVRRLAELLEWPALAP